MGYIFLDVVNKYKKKSVLSDPKGKICLREALHNIIMVYTYIIFYCYLYITVY